MPPVKDAAGVERVEPVGLLTPAMDESGQAPGGQSGQVSYADLLDMASELSSDDDMVHASRESFKKIVESYAKFDRYVARRFPMLRLPESPALSEAGSYHFVEDAASFQSCWEKLQAAREKGEDLFSHLGGVADELLAGHVSYGDEETVDACLQILYDEWLAGDWDKVQYIQLGCKLALAMYTRGVVRSERSNPHLVIAMDVGKFLAIVPSPIPDEAKVPYSLGITFHDIMRGIESGIIGRLPPRESFRPKFHRTGNFSNTQKDLWLRCWEIMGAIQYKHFLRTCITQWVRESVDHAKFAMHAFPHESPAWGMRLDTFSERLEALFWNTGKLSDLENAIGCHEERRELQNHHLESLARLYFVNYYLHSHGPNHLDEVNRLLELRRDNPNDDPVENTSWFISPM